MKWTLPFPLRTRLEIGDRGRGGGGGGAKLAEQTWNVR